MSGHKFMKPTEIWLKNLDFIFLGEKVIWKLKCLEHQGTHLKSSSIENLKTSWDISTQLFNLHSWSSWEFDIIFPLYLVKQAHGQNEIKT